jgi:CTP:molybdopterin cytidylyltransferase MocA
MGSPKALLPWRGRPWILHLIDALRIRCPEVHVVLGAHRDAIAAALPADIHVHWNPDWAVNEPRDSLRLGLSGLLDDQRVLCCPVDCVPPPLAVLDLLLAQSGFAVPHCGGRDGHPVLLTAGAARLGLADDTLRGVLAGAPRVAVDWPLLDLNLNTPADWQAFLRQH